ncbi:helix-turn-helix transcriptional regulator [Anaerotruncus colihominis]|uniref:XRE family transcriptional regulator n=2 Tax=Anaerotruncus colihominis TaxID=169435 RepID=A0A3E3ITV5_9FIRM|nr:helix-turn-helix transcriptional regulator [Clostridiales bacterium]RGE70371.1 XRE family transcriptional regulator [Anaerotruncus colihominis]
MVLLLYHVDTGQSTPRGGVSFVKGMTQAELAEKINVTQSMLCQIERGTKAPSWPLGTEIAVELNCALNDLSRFITVYGNNYLNQSCFNSRVLNFLTNVFKCTFKYTKQGGVRHPEVPMF